MTAQDKTTIKTYFETGDKPTQTQFANLIDSYQDANSNLTVFASSSNLVALASAAAPSAFGLNWLSVPTTAAAYNQLGIATTGTGLFVLASAPTVYNPTIRGTTTNDSAAAGVVGEYIFSETSATNAVVATTLTATNVTSIPLTGGDWDVWGSVSTNVGGGTVITITEAYISTASSTRATPPNGGAYIFDQQTKTGGTNSSYPVGTTIMRLAASANVYLGVFSQFSIGTNGYYGFIGARRRR